MISMYLYKNIKNIINIFLIKEHALFYFLYNIMYEYLDILLLYSH
jgi:hypothetical protein